MPPSGWSPDAQWPKPPPLWSFSIESTLRMRPIPLDEDINLGHPSEVTRKDLATAAQSAADSIAWRIAGIAAETKTVPTVANLKHTEMAHKAIGTARDRVFSRLIDDVRDWVNSLPWGSAEWHAAIAQSRMILDCRDAFAEAASRRITDVLNASTQTEETTISRDSPAPQPNPERSTPKPRPQSPQAAQTRQPPPPSVRRGAQEMLTNYKRAARKLATWAWVHAAIFTVGVFLTIAGYSSASRIGGTYVAFTGAILWGVIGCARNAYRYIKVKAVADELERASRRPAPNR